MPADASPPRMLERYTNALAIAFTALIFLELPWYINAAVMPALLPKFFYFAMFAAALPVIAARGADAVRWLGSAFGLWVLGLIALNLTHLAGTLDPDAPREIVARIEVLGLMLVLTFVLSQARAELLHSALPWIGLALAALVAMDFLAPDRIIPQPAPGDPLSALGQVQGRAAGTMGNPNKAGEAMALLLLLSMPLARHRVGWLLLCAVGAAVLMTASRSSIAGVALVVAGGFLLGTVPRLLVVAMAVAAAMLAMNPDIILEYLLGRSDLGFGNVANFAERLGTLLSGDFSDPSSGERFLVLTEGLRLFAEDPIVGAGAGATTFWNLPASTHNQAVLMLAEYGIIGGLFWVAMLALPFAGVTRGRGGLGQATLASLLMLLFSTATHNMQDFNYWLAAIALFSIGFPPTARVLDSGAAGELPHGEGLEPVARPQAREMRQHGVELRQVVPEVDAEVVGMPPEMEDAPLARRRGHRRADAGDAQARQRARRCPRAHRPQEAARRNVHWKRSAGGGPH